MRTTRTLAPDCWSFREAALAARAVVKMPKTVDPLPDMAAMDAPIEVSWSLQGANHRVTLDDWMLEVVDERHAEKRSEGL